jgi:hypothetical protein
LKPFTDERFPEALARARGSRRRSLSRLNEALATLLERARSTRVPKRLILPVRLTAA